MTDVFELLRLREEQNKLEKKYYVYYEPSTGEIIHFRNCLENDSYPYIEILESELDIPPLEFESRNYFVSQKNKKLELVKKNDAAETQFNIDNVVYQIPKVIAKARNQLKKNPYDLLIEQNNKDRVFRLKFSSEMKKMYYDRENLLQLKLHIYVTAEDDPNILYQILEFKMYDLITNAYYTIPFEDFNGEKCNLFSKKYFHLYLHADIR